MSASGSSFFEQNSSRQCELERPPPAALMNAQSSSIPSSASQTGTSTIIELDPQAPPIELAEQPFSSITGPAYPPQAARITVITRNSSILSGDATSSEGGSTMPLEHGDSYYVVLIEEDPKPLFSRRAFVCGVRQQRESKRLCCIGPRVAILMFVVMATAALVATMWLTAPERREVVKFLDSM
ncbi:hypothetical protein BJ742DRAFT_774489 [Cladochytrium replicatum]|nr:hypothetical protein BJ742DRAFT_774489 [Cladochytrium replicatum]